MNYFLILYVAPLVFSAAYAIFLGRLKYPEDGRRTLKNSFIPIANWLIVGVAILDLINPICKFVSNGFDKMAKWIIPDKD